MLDASALLAFLNEEPGADAVEGALGKGALISIVNWAEVISKAAEMGADPVRVRDELVQMGVLGKALQIVTLMDEDALEMARLRPATRSLGLSLGDRACLALGQRLGLPVLTADRLWSQVTLDLEIRLIR
ncbi:type II toxin-antitoxin system VapC family toxin [Polyangium aurulentum]|uniref:type II toxin-antitoxin system VapC family toxin n=1 Tax=Polyangium aurulentum TaxID=2567896 RepID=UPI00200BE969|nr:type II toxin-antitoxin system VapC family toxin [Polyangium aurulentum]UQA55988.1 type II toxin-antitoxin system VapC family toxin [Polyangium aurulentum]